MTDMIEAHASINVITDIFAVLKFLSDFPGYPVRYFAYYHGYRSYPNSRYHDCRHYLVRHRFRDHRRSVAGLAMTGAVANVKDNTTASAVVEKRRIDMIVAF